MACRSLNVNIVEMCHGAVQHIILTGIGNGDIAILALKYVVTGRRDGYTANECYPSMLTKDGEECVFPFLYYDSEITECQGYGSSAWCSTTYNYDNDGQYGYCDFTTEVRCDNNYEYFYE